MISLILYVTLSGYFLFTIFILWGWYRAILLSEKIEKNNHGGSIIIPFRDEAARISPLILSVKILIDKIENVEFIFVNDHSSDQSVSLLQKEFEGFTSVRIISLDNQYSGKKKAISTGVSISNFEYIITTDADCELSETAVRSMLYFLGKENIKMVCGAVSQHSGKGFASRLADLEFLSLIGSGISFWGLGIPFMANGAFLGFKKQAFWDVKGFEGNEQFAGGDDVFLLEKIKSTFGNKSIHFLSKAKELIITKGDVSIKDFLQRRIRWGAKAKAYPSTTSKVISILIFLLNVLYIVSLFSFISSYNWYTLIILLSIKYVSDLMLISSFIFRLKKWELLPYTIPATFLHPFYILFVGILSLTGKYDWKNRSYGSK